MTVPLTADNAIYLFHMPAFFLISGYTFSGSNKKWLRFVPRLAKSILLPYFIWSSILILMIIIIGGAANSEADWSDLVVIAYRPYSIFWFLYVLFFIQILAKFFIGIDPKGFVFVLFALSAFIFNFFGGLSLSVSASGILVFTLFFACGHALRSLQNYHFGVSAMIGATIIFAGTELFAIINQVSAESLYGRLWGIVLSIAFMTFFHSTQQWRLWSWAPIKFIGQNTLAIYCMHSIVTAGCRTFMVKIGWTDAPSLIVAGTLAGLLGPAIALLMMQRLRIAGWFGFPPPPARTTATERADAS